MLDRNSAVLVFDVVEKLALDLGQLLGLDLEDLAVPSSRDCCADGSRARYRVKAFPSAAILSSNGDTLNPAPIRSPYPLSFSTTVLSPTVSA